MSVFDQLAQVTYNYNYSTSPAASGATIGLFYLFSLPFIIVALAGLWKVYAKAGRPGWAAIIPVYNYWVLFEIAGKPGWWAILMVIPFVNIIGAVLYIIAVLEVARRFGKGGGYAVLMLLVPFVGYPMLGFGNATYNGGAPSGFGPATGPTPTPLA